MNFFPEPHLSLKATSPKTLFHPLAPTIPPTPLPRGIDGMVRLCPSNPRGVEEPDRRPSTEASGLQKVRHMPTPARARSNRRWTDWGQQQLVSMVCICSMKVLLRVPSGGVGGFDNTLPTIEGRKSPIAGRQRLWGAERKISPLGPPPARTSLNISFPSGTPPPSTPQKLDDRSLVHKLNVST